ncbi:hypothetical protein AAZX31_12G196700 [Glycine max]|uniref:Cysteine proteinase n=1 Tax=Glycine max TaxID=3847 RepID=K7LW54_SOYBN|nr:hypothetical protein GYH30_034423 [Glycine max]KRH27011.1 hypothetical protein GLYMA_12G208200v4 [Glycine max]
MKTTITLVAIINLLVLCNLWITASACPAKHNDNSSDSEVMRMRYESWLKKYGQKYRNKDEWEFRFEIYRANVQFIEVYNSQNYSYKLMDNKFVDLTNEEFRRMYLVYQPRSHLQTRFMYQKHGDLPKRIDWRTRGSCWSFSAVATVEDINKIKTGKLVSLSEQQLIDCDNRNGNEGCNGGHMETFTFITKLRNHAVAICGYENLPAHNENMLKAAVAHQPASVATDAGGYAFQLYSKGTFSGSCGKDLNHRMTIVGYGEENGEKYWLVKNSWAND